MEHDHQEMAVRTCWEEPAAVTVWVAMHFGQTVTHLTTESTPAPTLVADHTTRKIPRHEQLVFALNTPSDHLRILAGYADCLAAPDLLAQGGMATMPPALVVWRWFPSRRIRGLWLAAQAQVPHHGPPPLPLV